VSRRARTLAPRSITSLDPERRNAILLIAGIGIVIGLALALVAYGYYNDRIAPKHETVLKVGKREFDYAFFERRVRAEIELGRISQGNIANGLSFVFAVLEREELVRQAAKSSGVTASAEEVEEQIRKSLSLSEGISRDGFAENYRYELLRLKLSPDEYGESARAQVLEAKLRAQLAAAAPAQTDFVSMRLIQVASLEEAQQARQRIERDEFGNLSNSFGVVAAEVSRHASSETGGEMGWRARGSLSTKVEEVAFSLTGLSDVIEANGSFFLLYVRGTAVRDVGEEDRDEIGQQGLANLLTKTRDELGSEIVATEEQLQRLVISLNRSFG